MSCGDWVIREKTSKYIVVENHKCYGIILSKSWYDDSIIEYLKVILK